MIQKQKRLSLSLVIVGLAVSLVFAFTGAEDYNSGLLSGLGTSAVFVGIFRLMKLRRLSSDLENRSRMGALSLLRKQNQDKAAPRYGASELPAVLPEMQTDSHRQCGSSADNRPSFPSKRAQCVKDFEHLCMK